MKCQMSFVLAGALGALTATAAQTPVQCAEPAEHVCDPSGARRWLDDRCSRAGRDRPPIASNG